MTQEQLSSKLKERARQLGFTLVGITSSAPPAHLTVYQNWLKSGRHAEMAYLAEARAIERRADPCLILPECRSILVLGTPYPNPAHVLPADEPAAHGRVAAYALGTDYHLVLPERMRALVSFLEEDLGQPIPNRFYTDTGPILERELAMRAGLGWIGKNTCLINPHSGSAFLLSEILLGIDLPADEPFRADQCGSCTRCIDACPTACILPDRTLNAANCISYLTIENKGSIPEELRTLTANWVFGCDICQMVCPWNIRFASTAADPAFSARPGLPYPLLADELRLTAQAFNQKFKDSPLKRAKRRGYLRNVAVAAGNTGRDELLPELELARADPEPLVSAHAEWAARRLKA